MGLTQTAASPRKNELNYDPGLTQRYTGTLNRAINQDGRFNVRRAGRTWRDASPYLFLINVSWPVFCVLRSHCIHHGESLALPRCTSVLGLHNLKAWKPNSARLGIFEFVFLQHPYSDYGRLREHVPGRPAGEWRGLGRGPPGTISVRDRNRSALRALLAAVGALRL